VVKLLIGVTRANFLSLTLVCVALAATASWQSGAALSPTLISLVVVMALCAHVSANVFNEYFDFHSGLDFLTRRTPFSGGSGALVARPEAHNVALAVAVGSLAVVVLIGLYLAAQLDWRLLWIGIPGVGLIYAYTRYINRWPVMCLVAPGLGFGLMMTLGAFWVFAGHISAGAIVLTLMVTLLVSNLLLLNQFPDVEADRQVGRRHLPIVIGRRRSASVFTLLLGLNYALLVLAVVLRWLPPHTLVALLSLALLPRLLRGIYRYADQPEQLEPYLGMNVLLCHVLPLLLLIGLLWAGQH
jgi:1,4-dihydroxy-2-naphthoate polyprenyltransferase